MPNVGHKGVDKVVQELHQVLELWSFLRFANMTLADDDTMVGTNQLNTIDDSKIKQSLAIRNQYRICKWH